MAPDAAHPHTPAALPACRASAKTYRSPMLTIEARWEGQPACFGSPYICAIGDTVTGGALRCSEAQGVPCCYLAVAAGEPRRGGLAASLLAVPFEGPLPTPR